MTWQDDLAEFARERGSVLVGYARLLTGDLAEAEDLVQEVIVRVWSRRRRGADVAQVEAYVRRTVVNTYLDRTRREIGWRERARLIGPAPDVESPEHAAIARTDIEHALGLISPRERACVVLRFYEDLTVPDIARRLDLSEGAVKRYLSDALRRLGPLLGTTLGDPDDVPVSSPTSAKGARR